MEKKNRVVIVLLVIAILLSLASVAFMYLGTELHFWNKKSSPSTVDYGKIELIVERNPLVAGVEHEG